MAGVMENGGDALHRHIPMTEWLPSYERKWLIKDLVASLSVWAIAVPTALAYAGIVGVPVEYGLYACIFSLVGYAVFGSSRQLVVGPSSTTAIITAATVAPLAAGRGQETYITLTVLLALLVGVLYVLAGAARLGFIANFIARPVMEGFIVALSITIIVGQAGKLVGVKPQGTNTVQQFADLFRQLADWSWVTLALGAGCLLALFLMARIAPRLPAALLVMVLAIVVAAVFSLADHGVQVVGSIPSGVPKFAFTGARIRDISSLIPGALAIFVVGFGESIGIAKAYAGKNGYRIDANQELIGLGAANIGSGLLQGFPTGASLSKTAVGERAGSKTQLMTVGVAVLTLMTALFLSPLFKNLPQATLGAIVIFSIWKLVNFSSFRRYRRVKKGDFALALAAFFGVLLIDVLPGILIGVVLSLLAVIIRISWPHTALLGRDARGIRYGSLQDNPDFQPVSGLIIYRFDSPLIFSNAEGCADELRRLVYKADPPVKAVIIDCEMIHDMDTTAIDQLLELHADLAEEGVTLLMARAHSRVLDFMRLDGIARVIGEDNFFPTVRDAVAVFERHNPRPV